ncbi:MAG: LemA family protein [Bradyrhizobium sp.]|nr:LemA family protein [Bradyrhizobium sp.]
MPQAACRRSRKVCAICATSDSDRRHDMINGLKPLDRTLRWGMVGGGGGSQIGYIHRSAALRDNTFTLLAGAFDIDAERGRQFGQRLGVDPDRCYADYQSLFRSEAARPDGIQAVSVATPNNTHYAICRAALEAGLHVVCEKPLCFSSEEADELVALSQRVSQAFADIDVQLKQRHDLIPNLVETVKGYASHERGTLDEVIKARNAAISAQGPAQVSAAEGQLSGALGRLIALSEAYPDLKANANFQQLAGELSDIENKIAASRRFFNNAVSEYNTGIQQMPAALFAGTFGFTRKEFFDLGASRTELEAAPSVKF